MPSLVYDCFISYNRQDLDEVGRLCRELEGFEVRPWRDQDLASGAQWMPELHKWISDLPVFVAVIGPSGVSEWQNLEIQACLALGTRKPKIIPVVLPGVSEPLRLPPFLEIFHRVDLRSSSPDPLGKLVQAITGHRPETWNSSIAEIGSLGTIASSKHESAADSPSYLTWRMRQNEWLQQCLASRNKSRAELGQPLHVGDPETKLVARTTAIAQLDAWWQSWSEHHKRLVVLGEEGDGKTWVVGAWLNAILRTPTAPAVVFLPSTGAVNPDPIELISQIVNRQLGEYDPERWRQALTNWLDQAESKSPTLLLVLDGINERNSASFWRELLERLVGEGQKAVSIAVIVTCRSAYWHRHFARIPHIEELSRICELPPYDGAELATALRGTEVSPQSLPADLLALIRKPRYLALALKHLERLRDAGELTKERLIYEDWRYRLELRRSLSLDDRQFQDFLCSLAQKFRRGHDSFREPELIAALPAGIDPAAALNELLTGGIFVEAGGSRRLDHDRLQLGLGLLLVDELEQAEASHEVALDEVLAQWLEPYAEMDFKASVCHQAVLHALARRPPVAQGIQVALLREWTSRQNPEDGFKGAFAAYLPLNPSAYTGLAERVWCEESSNPWLERSLLLAWIKHWESPNVAAELYDSCERWLSFVHPARNEADRDGEDNERRQELENRLGFKLAPGDFSFAGYHFTVIEEVDLLRLGRLALALISHVPSAAWIPALMVGILAEAIMDFPIKYDLFAWVFRSTREDLWPAVKRRAEELIATGHKVALQAAYRLLSYHGSEEAQSLAATLPADLFPADHWLEEHEKDPCIGLYRWQRECCEGCLLREDIKALVLARRLEPWVADPTVQIPGSFVDRLCAVAEEVQGEKLWPDLCRDHDSETIVITLAAAAPERVAKMVQSWVRSMPGRGSAGAWRLALEVTSLQLLLSEAERKILLDFWTHLATGENLDRNENVAEAFLFGMLLPEMKAEEQLAHVLGRKEGARDLRRFEAAFRPLELPALFKLEFDNATSVSDLVRILWFLSVNAEYLPRELVEQISAKCCHKDKMVRLCALRTLCRSGFSMAGRWLTGCGWRAAPKNELESFWGSLILAEHGHHLSWKELVHGIDPSYLGYAVEKRGFRPDEVEFYALALDQAWSSLSGVKSEAAPDLPAIEILINISGRSAPQPRQLRLFEEEESRGITWIRRGSTWGGKEESDGLEIDRLLEPSEEQERLKHEAVEAEIQRQRDLGNFWFGREFYTNALDRVLTQSPELLERWLSAEDQVVRRLDSFYRGLCHILLKSRPEQGLSLYHRLKSIRFRNHASWRGSDLLDLYLFEAPASPPVEAAWGERLDTCNSDRELLELVIAGEKGNGATWLWRVCERDLSSTMPFRQARAFTLLGFSSLPHASQMLADRLSSGLEEGWLQRTAQEALLSWRRNDWARHWYRVFLSSESDSVSGAAFQLFLRCVDRRFWAWEALQHELRAVIQNHWRRRFFYKNNESTIENRIKDNEKELDKTFAGCKVLKDEASPWIERSK